MDQCNFTPDKENLLYTLWSNQDSSFTTFSKNFLNLNKHINNNETELNKLKEQILALRDFINQININVIRIEKLLGIY
jgi:septal ring factor EnvC (AmiA/AmiB activator)